MGAWGRNIANLVGTLAVTEDSVDVVGTGTAFLTAVKPGNVLTIASQSYVVASIQSDTALKLTKPYAGSTASGLTVKLSEKPSADGTIDLDNVYGVSQNEVRINNLPSPGWAVRKTVGTRQVWEVLVAMKTPPVEDPADNTVLPETTTTTTAAPTTTTTSTTAAPTTTTTTTP